MVKVYTAIGAPAIRYINVYRRDNGEQWLGKPWEHRDQARKMSNAGSRNKRVALLVVRLKTAGENAGDA